MWPARQGLPSQPSGGKHNTGRWQQGPRCCSQSWGCPVSSSCSLRKRRLAAMEGTCSSRCLKVYAGKLQGAERGPCCTELLPALFDSTRPPRRSPPLSATFQLCMSLAALLLGGWDLRNHLWMMKQSRRSWGDGITLSLHTDGRVGKVVSVWHTQTTRL